MVFTVKYYRETLFISFSVSPNVTDVTLKESDLITADDYVGETQLFELNDLQLDNTVPHSFVFREVS